MKSHFLDYYRCPEYYAALSLNEKLANGHEPASMEDEYPHTRFTTHLSRRYKKNTYAEMKFYGVDVEAARSNSQLSSEIAVENIQRERYVNYWNNKSITIFVVRGLYYLARPYFPVSIRKHLQALYLRGWKKIEFPRWPVDITVGQIHRKRLIRSVQSMGGGGGAIYLVLARWI